MSYEIPIRHGNLPRHRKSNRGKLSRALVTLHSSTPSHRDVPRSLGIRDIIANKAGEQHWARKLASILGGAGIDLELARGC